MTEKESREGNTMSLRLGDELNYRQEYEYEEGYAHRAKRIGERYYRYDLNGNVAAERDGEFKDAAGAGSGQSVIASGDLYAVEYGWGISNPDGGTGAEEDAGLREYRWDERNRLVESRDSRYTVAYRYGSDGERAGKHSVGDGEAETLYFNKLWSWHYDSQMYDEAGRNSKHVYVGETRIATKVARAGSGGSTNEEEGKHHLGDHLGSAQVVSDANGNEYERIEYTPYGEVWIEGRLEGSNLDISYRFTGKERDGETGLYYYGARYLDAKAGRWLSVDPALGEYIPSAPISDEARKRNGNLPGMGGIYNTVNAHLYHYAGNNPVRYTDPDGRTAYELSTNGISLLKKLEGSVKNDQNLLIPYNDLNNNATKGYGILLHYGPLTQADLNSHPPQTEEQASVDLINALSSFETIVNNRTTYTFPNNIQTVDNLQLSGTQADALIILTYNSPSAGKSVVDAIRAGKTQNEIKDIWLGDYAADSGLGKRRAVEWQLYSTGVYAENPYE
jgi:RHS repeat-associated protein